MRYYVRENQGKMNQFFMVDEDSGEVFLRRSLLDDTDDRYEVRDFPYKAKGLVFE